MRAERASDWYDGYVVTTPCARCGVDIEHFPSQPRKYCSHRCRAAGRPELAPRFCATCGEEYEPNSARQKHCATCSPTKGARARLRRYSVTADQWAGLVSTHGGKCWLCRKRPATCLDHSHRTGRARGALCRTCNMALHYLEDEVWLRSAQQYLVDEGGDDPIASIA